MFASYSFIVLAWGLLLAPVADAAELGALGPLAGVRRIDLKETRAPLPEVHIGPGLTTTVLFDSPIRLDEVVLEGRERFQRLGMSEDHLVLVPSSTFVHGEQLRLEVRFRDDAAPERAAFMLVVDAARVERQVEIYRQPRTAESYRVEVEELKKGIARLRQEVGRLHQTNAPTGGSDSLPATIARVLEVEATPLTFGRQDSSVPASVSEVNVVRLSGRWLALSMILKGERGSGAWTAVEVVLRDARGQAVKALPPWQQGPVRPGTSPQVVIMMEDEAALPSGRYTLELWDEGRGQHVTLEGLEVH
ncbi:DUF2381 family protein [Pyxidicoccus sp. MSG2]|uniref:DUF2381 family protein n=1 Tax=Pyxidicoccus sp. MSG2 TaxID=2996790 RepID=UPI0022703564|nr:DUF2381 family protein [Pyxidicoccus sp. MSG2]MCY1015499.1 DUF2381 family protein [Pyxidicoccus sp. MSG2]